jgi:hypothetical protein
MRQAFRPLLVTAVLFASSAFLLGCGRPYEPATPSGFVDLGEDRYDQDTHEYRASTADGVVLGVRAYDNDPEVDLTLVGRALENRLRLGQGYALLEKKEVSARDGTKGIQLRFGHDEGSGPHLYLVTVFITSDRVFVLEAGGKRELFEKAQASIDWSVKNFLPD